jgi:hypothetical protein
MLFAGLAVHLQSVAFIPSPVSRRQSTVGSRSGPGSRVIFGLYACGYRDRKTFHPTVPISPTPRNYRRPFRLTVQHHVIFDSAIKPFSRPQDWIPDFAGDG